MERRIRIRALSTSAIGFGGVTVAGAIVVMTLAAIVLQPEVTYRDGKAFLPLWCDILYVGVCGVFLALGSLFYGAMVKLIFRCTSGLYAEDFFLAVLIFTFWIVVSAAICFQVSCGNLQGLEARPIAERALASSAALALPSIAALIYSVMAIRKAAASRF